MRVIFDEYSLIGDKNNLLDLSLSGYIKFLQDCGLLNNNINQNLNLNSNLHSNLNSNKKILDNKNNIIRGDKKTTTIKLTKNDIYIMFNDICGIKNFDFSKSIRYQFKDNSSNIIDFSECKNYVNLSDRKYSNSKDVKIQRLNFSLFIKSFEYLAKKIYPDLSNESSFIKFFQDYIINFIRKKSQFSLKKKIISSFEKLKTDDIVMKNNINKYF